MNMNTSETIKNVSQTKKTSFTDKNILYVPKSNNDRIQVKGHSRSHGEIYKGKRLSQKQRLQWKTTSGKQQWQSECKATTGISNINQQEDMAGLRRKFDFIPMKLQRGYKNRKQLQMEARYPIYEGRDYIDSGFVTHTIQSVLLKASFLE